MLNTVCQKKGRISAEVLFLKMISRTLFLLICCCSQAICRSEVEKYVDLSSSSPTIASRIMIRKFYLECDCSLNSCSDFG